MQLLVLPTVQQFSTVFHLLAGRPVALPVLVCTLLAPIAHMRTPAARHSPASYLPVARQPLASCPASRQPRSSHLPAACLPSLPLACLLSADTVRNCLSSQMCTAGGQALTRHSSAAHSAACLPLACRTPAARLPLACLSSAKRLPLASCACQLLPLTSCSQAVC